MSHSPVDYYRQHARAAILSTIQAWFQSDMPTSRGPIDVGNGQSDPEMFWIDATTMDYPFQTIFSLGLSNQSLEMPSRTSKFNRNELLMHLPISWPASGKRLQLAEYQWPEVWLRQLVRSISSGSIQLPGTHVILSNDEPPAPLGPGTDQTCLLLIADFYQCFPVNVGENDKVHFYHVIPLYTEERDFERANGMHPLLEAMAVKGLESLVISPDRDRFIP